MSVPGRGGAVVGRLGHADGDDLVEGDGELGAALGHAGRRVHDVRVGRRRVVVARERHLAGEGLDRQARQRVDVGGGPDAHALQQLGRHVVDRPEHLAGDGEGEARGVAREAEVGEVHGRARIEQDVGRLDVAVDHVGGMGRVERVGHRGEDGDGIVDGDGARGDEVAQRARGQPGGDVELAVDLAHPVDRDDVGVVQGGQHAALATEALAVDGVDRDVVAQHLEGDLSP